MTTVVGVGAGGGDGGGGEEIRGGREGGRGEVDYTVLFNKPMIYLSGKNM